ncbi:MAG TPA: MFS transporter [Trueperaceae bacterium]
MTESLPGRLWNRDYLAYLLGIALTALGDAFVLVALPFLVLELTDSPEALATAVLLGTLPRFLGPITGALADRLHLRIPLMTSSLLRATLFAGMALLYMDGSLPLWVVYGGAFLNGLLTSFIFAAGMVLVPNLVPRSELARANSFMQAALMGLPLVGLGAAGALVGVLGVGGTILVASPCLLALFGSAALIRFPPRPRQSEGLDFLGDMAAAGRYLLASAPLAFLLLMSLVLNACLNMLNVTMPVVMEETGRGAQGFGLFESSFSAGMLLGIAAVSVVARSLPARFQISVSQVFMALGLAILSLGGFTNYLGGGFVLGLGLGFSEVAAVTLLQLAVPDGMRGKVLGIVFTANALGLAIGAWLAGVLVGVVPMSAIYLVGAGTVAVIAVAWTLLHIQQREQLERLMEAAA